MGWPTAIVTSWKVDGSEKGFGTNVPVSGNFCPVGPVGVPGLSLSASPTPGLSFPDGASSEKWEFSGTVPYGLKNTEQNPIAMEDGFQGDALRACALLVRTNITVAWSKTPNDGGTINVSCGRRTKIGEVVTFECASNHEDGYVVDYVEVWNGKETLTFNGNGQPTISGRIEIPGIITAGRPIQFDAHFKKPKITVSTTHIGYGTTTPITQQVTGGNSYTITATPDTGRNFLKWISSDGKIVLDQATTTQKAGIYDVKWTACFSTTEHTVTLKTNDESMGTVTGGGKFPYNKQIVLTATPKTGYLFDYWSEPSLIRYRRVRYTVAGDIEITATFKPKKVSMYYSSSPVGSCTYLGDKEYNYGEQVSIPAVPETGYEFEKWVGESETSSTLSFTAREDKFICAKCKKAKYNVYASATEGGTVSGGGTYEYEDTAKLIAYPSSGYYFSYWEVNSGSAGGGKEMTIKVTNHTTVKAVFKHYPTALIYDN